MPCIFFMYHEVYSHVMTKTFPQFNSKLVLIQKLTIEAPLYACPLRMSQDISNR